MKLKKLNPKGFSHDLVAIAFVAVFAIAGVGYLVASHADTCDPVSGTVSGNEGGVVSEASSEPIYNGSCEPASGSVSEAVSSSEENGKASPQTPGIVPEGNHQTGADSVGEDKPFTTGTTTKSSSVNSSTTKTTAAPSAGSTSSTAGNTSTSTQTAPTGSTKTSTTTSNANTSGSATTSQGQRTSTSSSSLKASTSQKQKKPVWYKRVWHFLAGS